MSDNKTRCPWCLGSELMMKYHDEEWGVPLFDDQKLFEFMVLDGFQAGLSWSTILNKRENFRKAFDNFDAVKISRYNDAKKAELMQDAGIIRNRLKIEAVVTNAKAFLETQREYGTFSKYIWSFTGGKPLIHHLKDQKEIQARTEVSDAMSKALLKRGFKFVGSTLCYAFMQASGMVMDHLESCHRYQALKS